MSALVVLPLVCFAGLYLLLYKTDQFGGHKALITAGNLLLLIVCFQTELLSLFNHINYTWICLFWIVATCAISLRAFRHVNLNAFYLPHGTIPWYSLILLLVLLTTLSVALGAPSNTWDGMTYHMSRVVHWINNQSIAYYSTPIVRQNYMPPLSEEVILQLQILSRGDHFSNLVSWFFFSLALVALGAITAELNLNRTYQWLSVVLASLIPMAIFQATGCKNDTTLSFLFLSFVYFLLRLAEKPTWAEALLAGISLGLGLYCKTTFLILGGSFGLWYLALYAFGKHPAVVRLFLLKSLCLIVLIGIIISSAYWIREVKTGFEGIRAEAALQNNQDKTPKGITANLVRSIAVELTLPIPAWNQGLYAGVKTLLGSCLNDPKTTYPGFQYLAYYWPHEDHMGNFIPFILILVAMLYLLLKFTRLTEKEKLLLLTALSAVLVFTFLLKWQPWINRLYTPLFLLATPLICCALKRLSQSYKIVYLKLIITSSVVLSLLCALPALFINSSRPILSPTGQGIFQVDRESQYFVNRPELRVDYLAIDKILKQSHLGNTSVGLLLGPDDWEYPLLVLSGSMCGNEKAAYKLHALEPGKPERIIVALGSMATVLSKNTNLRVVYQGTFAALYEAK